MTTPSPTHAIELRRTWELVPSMVDEVAELFYARLFELDPSLRILFRTEPAVLRQKLMDMLSLFVRHADQPGDLLPLLIALGERHVTYGVRHEHYATVCDALLWTLDDGMGLLDTPEARNAWVWALDFVTSAMSPTSPEETALRPGATAAASHAGARAGNSGERTPPAPQM